MSVIISLLLCLTLVFSSFAFNVSAKEKNQLQFNKDGKFTILNFSDIQDKIPTKQITLDLIKDTLDRVNPDLVVLTGDNIAGHRTKTKLMSELAIRKYMDIFEDYGVNVAMVFGNHDDDGNNEATKEYQMEIYESYDNFVGYDEGDALSYCGTYNLPIISSDGKKVAFNIWMTDSGTYNDENDLGGYGCVHKDQIEWYKKTSDELKKENGGNPVYSINFQHIVVPEIWDALVKNEDGTYSLPEGAAGELNEDPCPPKYTNGQFDAFIEQGDLLATVSGHDHVNNYVVNYKGIQIINTPGVGFRSYHNHCVGSRVFVIDENDPIAFETYCLSYSDIYPETDKAAQYRYEIHNEDNDTLAVITAVFNYIFALIEGIFVK